MNSDFNPLGAPGVNQVDQGVLNPAASWKVGSYVTTAVNSTPFFSQRPGDNSTAELLLPAGTMMRVVKVDSSFLKVELDDQKVGYVAVAMIRPPASAMNNGMPAPTTLGNGLPGDLPPSSAGDVGALPKLDPSTGLPMPPVTLPGDALPPSSLDSGR